LSSEQNPEQKIMSDRFGKTSKSASEIFLRFRKRAEKFKSFSAKRPESRQARARYLRVEKTNLIRRRLPTEL
jgi:hypothetical protein